MDRNETFAEILERLKKSAHGTAELVELTEFLSGLKKEKRPFLQSRFIEAAISWDLNRSREVWETDEEANKNIYWLSKDAWHILNAVLQSKHTRATNMTESERLRTSIQGIE